MRIRGIRAKEFRCWEEASAPGFFAGRLLSAIHHQWPDHLRKLKLEDEFCGLPIPSIYVYGQEFFWIFKKSGTSPVPDLWCIILDVLPNA